MDDFAIRSTAWISLLAWSASEWVRSSRGGQAGLPRLLFTLGLLAMLLHSFLAFALRYGFSHEAALLDAARQIEEVTGRPSSPRGFYANHVFMAWWTVEALRWWWSPGPFAARPLVLTWLSRAVFAFMFVNGAIVFAHGFGRALGVAAVLVAAGAWLRTWKGPRPAQV